MVVRDIISPFMKDNKNKGTASDLNVIPFDRIVKHIHYQYNAYVLLKQFCT